MVYLATLYITYIKILLIYRRVETRSKEAKMSSEKTKMVHVAFTEKEKQSMAVYAASNQISMSELIRRAVAEYMTTHPVEGYHE